MNKFFIPTSDPEDWKSLLAEPDKHWKTGYSAKSLAYCWHKANDFPLSVKRVLEQSKLRIFQDIEMLLAFPEYKVPLPGGRRASQNDIFILAKGDKQLISITVEGKVKESFGELVCEWKSDKRKGKQIRLNYLCGLLHLDEGQIGYIRYQLLHRTASAIILAKRFNAPNALMLVHSFSQQGEQENENFQDYYQFLSLFGLIGKMNALTPATDIDGISLYFGWVTE